MDEVYGGRLVAEVMHEFGVGQLYTLCGGHISPILLGADELGIRVVDCRHEASAVFAADAAARLTGGFGVAAVTAGPGVTNAVTALENALIARTPLVLLGGATAGLLKGRGSLQDIDQMAIMEPLTKWARSVSCVRDIRPVMEKAFRVAGAGVPGPVFVELPLDILYPESQMRAMVLETLGAGKKKTLQSRAVETFARGYLYRKFHLPGPARIPDLPLPVFPDLQDGARRAAALIARAKKPVLVLGSGAVSMERDPDSLATAVSGTGLPVWLSGMARGLLGADHPRHLRHKRGQALREADLVLTVGVPFDFRMGYGRSIHPKATVISVGPDRDELTRNRRPQLTVVMPGATFLRRLGKAMEKPAIEAWLQELRKRESEREAEIDAAAEESTDLINPVQFFRELDRRLPDDAILVADGGDFVATASYILRPRRPLSWLDPGAYGTLGVGGGFALGAAFCRPASEVWLLWGDGSSAYSLAEFDTFVRHGLAPIAVVGNDASWQQIARGQVEMLGDPIGTVLNRTAYDEVAKGYGGAGLVLQDPARIGATIDEARSIARSGRPVLINVHLGKTGFRDGSVSV